MAASIEQLNQSLAELDNQVAELGDRLRQTYADYLEALQKATQQQLILACYHICTEGYPDEFLHLSVSDRQTLQATLRKTAKQVAPAFQQLLLLQIGDADLVPEELTEEEFEVQAEDQNLEEADEEDDPAQELASLLAGVAAAVATKRPPNPVDRLGAWQEAIERSIRRVLHQASYEANQVLRDAGILPNALPNPVLDAAARSDNPEQANRVSHVVQMLVEAPTPSSPEMKEPPSKRPPNLIHVIAVQLRLSELEFKDTTVMVWRNRVRELTQKMKILNREYRKRQRQRAIAEAQVAWRSTWINEAD